MAAAMTDSELESQLPEDEALLLRNDVKMRRTADEHVTQACYQLFTKFTREVETFQLRLGYVTSRLVDVDVYR